MAAPQTEQPAGTFTVREMIQKLAQCENMDATCHLNLGQVPLADPVTVHDVDYDPENEMLIISS